MANLNTLEEKELMKVVEAELDKQRRMGIIVGGKAISKGVVDIIDQSTLSDKDTLRLIRRYCMTAIGEEKVNKD